MSEAPRRSRFTLSWRVAALIAVILVASAVVTTVLAVRSIRAELQEATTEAVGNVHAAAAALIQAEYDGIQRYRQEALERRKAGLRDELGPVMAAVQRFYEAQEAGELSEKRAQEMALDVIRSARYGDDDYFFAYDDTMVAIAHPDERFQGRNLSDLQDANGKYVVRELHEVARALGAGYVEYDWQRLNAATASPKIGYVELFAPWNWTIGTGVYVDDIDAEVQRRIGAAQADLNRTLAQVSFAGDGFFFIIDRQGNIIASGSPVVEEAGQTDAGKAIQQEILAKAPTDPGQVTSVVVDAPWPLEQGQSWSLRLSTTGGDLDWVLVSAVPEATIAQSGRLLALQLIAMSVVVLLIGLALGVLVSRRITKPVDEVTAAARGLADGDFDPESLDGAAARSDEIGELARVFQRMGTEIVERERRLRAQVEELTVRIDRDKVEQEVQEITETDYFQRLKARADELRGRDS